QALAEDLRAYLDDRPVRARPATATERAWKWARRNRAAAALVVTTAVLLLSLAAGGWLSALVAGNRLREGRRGQDLRGRYQACMAEGELAFRAGRYAEAKERFTEARALCTPEPGLSALADEAGRALAEVAARERAQAASDEARARDREFDHWLDEARFHATLG